MGRELIFPESTRINAEVERSDPAEEDNRPQIPRRKTGWGDAPAPARAERGEAPRSGFAKPAKPGNGGKVFVPRDFAKKPYKPAR